MEHSVLQPMDGSARLNSGFRSEGLKSMSLCHTYLEVHVKKRLLCLRVCTYIYVKSCTHLFFDVTLLPCYPAPECQTYTRYTETAV